MKGYLRPFQRIVRLYRDSNLRRDEMKDIDKRTSAYLDIRGHGILYFTAEFN